MRAGGKPLWWIAKILQGIGLIVVLVGVLLSMKLGLQDQGTASINHEMNGLLAGGGMFALGWLLERRLGAR